MAKILYKERQEGQNRLECIEWNEIEVFTKVKLDDKYNFINTEGQLVSNQWFDWIGEFNEKEGFAQVKLNGKWNFINAKGQLLSQQGFDWPWEFFYEPIEMP